MGYVPIFFLLSLPAHAQGVKAEIDCRFTGKDYIYDCVVHLARGGAPLAGAQLSVGADMPSMPMAHNLKPVQANPGKKPGEYEARLDLEMAGEWALKLRLSGPVRDLLVLNYEFDQKGARPAVKRSGTPPRK